MKKKTVYIAWIGLDDSIDCWYDNLKTKVFDDNAKAKKWLDRMEKKILKGIDEDNYDVPIYSDIKKQKIDF